MHIHDLLIYCYGEQVGGFPVWSVYVRNLRSSERFYELQEGQRYVMADCDDHGNLKSSYYLIQKVYIFQDVLLKCSCESSKYQRERYDSYLQSSDQHSNIIFQERVIVYML